MDLEGRVLSEDVEVGVGVQHRHLLANRNRADQAVDQRSDRLASTSADAVQGCSCLVVGWTRWQHGGASEKPAELSKVSVISRAGEDLHPHGVADGDLSGEEPVHLITGR